MVANQGVRAVLEGEEYAECVKEFAENKEIRDGILLSLLEETGEEAIGDLPVGFAGFYELIGIVSHMVGEMGWVHGRVIP